MRTWASTEKLPPCSHSASTCASSADSWPRRSCSLAVRKKSSAAFRPAGSCSRGQAPALEYRKHPLAHRQARDDLVGQMRGGFHPTAGGAGRADAATLAGVGDQEVVPTVCVAGTSSRMYCIVHCSCQHPSALSLRRAGGRFRGRSDRGCGCSPARQTDNGHTGAGLSGPIRNLRRKIQRKWMGCHRMWR